MRALKQPTYLNPHLELYKITVLLPSKWTKLAVSEYKLTGYIGPWVRDWSAMNVWDTVSQWPSWKITIGQANYLKVIANNAG
jgi:hypothetical protein